MYRVSSYMGQRSRAPSLFALKGGEVTLISWLPSILYSAFGVRVLSDTISLRTCAHTGSLLTPYAGGAMRGISAIPQRVADHAPSALSTLYDAPVGGTSFASRHRRILLSTSSKLPSLAVVSKQRVIQHAWRLLLLLLRRVVFFTLLRFICLRITQQVTYLSILARASKALCA